MSPDTAEMTVSDTPINTPTEQLLKCLTSKAQIPLRQPTSVWSYIFN